MKIRDITERKETRQLKDPSKEVMVSKNGKTIVIDKDKEQEYLSKGWGLAESATAGATTAGSIASIASVPGGKRKISKKGKYGAPEAPQVKNSDGTAKNALDVNKNIMGGKTIKR
jgi:hypothetical protein